MRPIPGGSVLRRAVFRNAHLLNIIGIRDTGAACVARDYMVTLFGFDAGLVVAVGFTVGDDGEGVA